MGEKSRVITDGPRPKHAQLRDALAELAATEGPDVAIPSERDLMAAHGVSRATVRKAIDGLVSDGLLQRIHGKGTFVARPRLESRLHLASFSQDMRRRGLVPSTRALGIELEQPPADIAESLHLGAGDRAVARRAGPARRRPADRPRARVVPRAAAARADPARPRRVPLRGLPRPLRAGHRSGRADAVGRGRRSGVRRAARRAAAHPTPCLPAGLHLGREAAGARRVPISGRPLPAAHVTGHITQHITGPRRCRHQPLGRLDNSERRQQ